MKILMVNKFLYPNGGSETYIFEISKCLEAMGHEVQFFGMEHENRIVGNHAEQYTNNMDFHGGKLQKLAYPFKIIYSKEAAKKITAVLEDFRPDVVHMNNINFQLTPSIIDAIVDYDLARKETTTMVVTAHDSQWVCPGHLLRVPSDGRRCFDCEGGKYMNCAKNRCIHNSKMRSLLGAFEAYFYKMRGTYGLVDKVICPSDFIREKLETNPELADKCITLHNFINISKEDTGDIIADKTGAADETKADTGNEAADTPTGDYVLYLGRFSEEKGIDTMIKVCTMLNDIPFVFAGSGPLKEQVDAVENIKDVGFVNAKQVREYITGAKFVVFPSECHENCSFTVMESISYGTPIIASNTGGTPELVNDGVNGELFEAGDVDELAGKIRNLWNDEEKLKAYRQGCRETSFDSVETYCEKLIGIYDIM